MHTTTKSTGYGISGQKPGDPGAGREHFVSGCYGKTQFATRAEAERTRQLIEKRKHVKRNGKRWRSDARVAYKCPHCNLWHLGRDRS